MQSAAERTANGIQLSYGSAMIIGAVEQMPVTARNTEPLQF